jgi:hypothetical protein
MIDKEKTTVRLDKGLDLREFFFKVEHDRGLGFIMDYCKIIRFLGNKKAQIFG